MTHDTNNVNNIEIEKPKYSQYFETDKLNKNLKKRAVRGAGLTVSARMMSYLIQMAGTVILARLLTPDDFGLVAMVTSVILFLGDIGVFGLSDATIQSSDLTQAQVSNLFWLNVILSVFITLIAIGIAPLLSTFYKEPRLTGICIAIAFNFLFLGFSTQHIALLKRSLQFGKVIFCELSAMVLSTGIAIYLATTGMGYWALVMRYTVMPLFTLIGVWILCSWRPSLPSRNAGTRPLFSFGLHTFLTFFVGYFAKSIDKIMLGKRWGSQQLAFYDRAYHLFVMPANQITYPLSSVASSTLSKLRNNRDEYLRYYLKSLSFLAFIGMPLSGVLNLISGDLVLLLLGEQWIQSGFILCLFAQGVGFMLIGGTQAWLHFSLGRADRLFRWQIFNFLINVILFFIAAPFGGKGMAIAYSGSFILLLFPGLLYAGKHIGLKFNSVFNCIWRYFITAIVTLFVLWAITHKLDFFVQIFSASHPIIRIGTNVTLFLGMYLVFLLLFFRNTNNINDFFQLITSMFSIKRKRKTRPADAN